jgi:hypothetical protein
MSVLVDLYPHLAPGLCGQLSCHGLCSKYHDCPAGQRRRRDRLARNAWRQFTVKVDRRRLNICERIHDAGQCPYLCREVGGCFLPKVGDHPSEAMRKVFRAQLAMDAFVRHGYQRQGGVK